MRGNFFDSFVGITAFGESHGKAIGVVIEDVKPNIEFPLKKIQDYLDDRKPGKNKFTSSRQEKDRVQIMSGIFENKTTGMPICLLIWNEDAKSSDYENLKNIFRPGHADYSYFKKFKIYDYRGGGRASGRETIARVAAAGLTDRFLDGIEIDFDTIQIGDFVSKSQDNSFENPLFWHDKNNYENLNEYLNSLKKIGDSVGGIIQITVSNPPAGLGDPVFEKLDANLAKALLSIGSIKGIEFGKGFEFGKMIGSHSNDQMDKDGFLSNNSGGILGGISNGDAIQFRVVTKPVPSISIKQKTIDANNNEREIQTLGRHDTCIIPRVIPVIKAMIKLVLADAIQYQNLLESKESNLADLRESIDKIDEDIILSLARRQKIVEKIALHKLQSDLEIIDYSREEKLYASLDKKATALQLDNKLIKRIWKEIISLSKKKQQEILSKKKDRK
ncbi:MAG: chorismate synthase [Candidatus Cloacimonadota bacterium]|nr:chorismate synthase [Candidatus Cloacimonadota bacterium]